MPWPFAGRLGGAPHGVRFGLESDADEDLLDTLIRLTERFCVALQTLAVRPELSVVRAG